VGREVWSGSYGVAARIGLASDDLNSNVINYEYCSRNFSLFVLPRASYGCCFAGLEQALSSVKSGAFAIVALDVHGIPKQAKSYGGRRTKKCREEGNWYPRSRLLCYSSARGRFHSLKHAFVAMSHRSS